jgi:hypothetical protein
MFSRKTRLTAVAAAAIAAGTSLGALAATSAGATTLPPRPAHQACDWNLNGFNILDLTFQGSTFKYPIFLRVADNGLIRGVLVDNGLPAGQQVLRVHGFCNDSNVILDTNYPSVDPQGSRAEDMVVTPVANHPHRGTVAGDWTETGTEQGSGLASLERTVRVNF